MKSEDSFGSYSVHRPINIDKAIIICVIAYGLTNHIRYKFGDLLDFKSITLLALSVFCLSKIAIKRKINNPLKNKLVFVAIVYIFFQVCLSRYFDPVRLTLVGCIILCLLSVDVRGKSNNNSGSIGFIFSLSSLLLILSLSIFFWTVFYSSESILADSSLWIVKGFAVYEVLFGQIIAFQGFSNDPNLVGNSLVFLLFFSMYCVRPRYLGFLMVAICCLAILLSCSRGSFVAMATSVSISLALFRYRLFSAKLLLFVSLTFMVLLGVANYFFALGDKLTRGADRRFSEWGQAVSIDRNMLLGADVGSISQHLGKHAESGFINLYVEYGLIGLCLFLLVALRALYVGAKNFRSQNGMDRVFFSSVLFLFITLVFTSGEISFLLWLGIFWTLRQDGGLTVRS